MKLIISFFLCWSVPTVLFFYFPVPHTISSFQLNLTLYLFVGLYLFLASSLSCWVIMQVFYMKPRSLFLYGALVLVLLFAPYMDTSRTGSPQIFLSSLTTANLLFGSTLLGTVLSVAVKRVGELVPVCITAAAVDIASVFLGPTKVMAEDLADFYSGNMQGVPPLVDSVLIKVGVPGHQIPVPLFGVSDWILLVLLSSALLRLNMSDNLLGGQAVARRYIYFPVSALALYISLLTAQIAQIFLPAMVFISGIFLSYLIIKYRVHRELKKSDYLHSLIFPVLVIIVILLFSQGSTVEDPLGRAEEQEIYSCHEETSLIKMRPFFCSLG